MSNSLQQKHVPSDSYVSIEGISHRYKGGVQVLDNVSLNIGVGLFGLLGANGAGKSTMMRIICTLLEPSDGSVKVCGHDVVKERNKVRELLGYVPQDFGAWESQTVSNVLEILASLSGLSARKSRKAKIAEMLDTVGLTEVADRKVKKLSGGMLRRLGVAQALMHDPKVLVMDEPTVGLDPEERLRFRQMMSTLGKDRAIILSTHIVADLGSTCSRLALIHTGKLEFSGSPTELLALAEGRVFEIVASPGLMDRLEEREHFEIVAQMFRDGKSILRGVDGVGSPDPTAVAVDNITLEEAYLAFTLNQGRGVDEDEAA